MKKSIFLCSIFILHIICSILFYFCVIQIFQLLKRQHFLVVKVNLIFCTWFFKISQTFSKLSRSLNKQCLFWDSYLKKDFPDTVCLLTSIVKYFFGLFLQYHDLWLKTQNPQISHMVILLTFVDAVILIFLYISSGYKIWH